MKLFSIPSTLGVRVGGGSVFIALAVRLNDADQCWWVSPGRSSGFWLLSSLTWMMDVADPKEVIWRWQLLSMDISI